jgi:hypothetical protein
MPLEIHMVGLDEAHLPDTAQRDVIEIDPDEAGR